MDTTFNNLRPCNNSATLEETKTQRQKSLYNFFVEHSPDVFLVELYPFGRKAFRFELDPVLTGIKTGDLSPCLSLCSLRDILVERHDKTKFEKRIITTLNSLFGGLLIHGDRTFIKLDETFSRVEDIAIPYEYTGYVTRPSVHNQPFLQPETTHLPTGSKHIITSIGGGNVGGELLTAVIKAHDLLDDESLYLQIFTGPYAPASLVETLRNSEKHNVRIDRFTTKFPELLETANLSISMAGYNTCMNVLTAGIPAIFYPFRQNQEQNLRVSRLQKLAPCTVLAPEDLTPPKLADSIEKQLKYERFISPVDLHGATKTADIVDTWYTTFRHKHEI